MRSSRDINSEMIRPCGLGHAFVTATCRRRKFQCYHTYGGSRMSSSQEHDALHCCCVMSEDFTDRVPPQLHRASWTKV